MQQCIAMTVKFLFHQLIFNFIHFRVFWKMTLYIEVRSDRSVVGSVLLTRSQSYWHGRTFIECWWHANRFWGGNTNCIYSRDFFVFRHTSSILMRHPEELQVWRKDSTSMLAMCALFCIYVTTIYAAYVLWIYLHGIWVEFPASFT